MNATKNNATETIAPPEKPEQDTAKPGTSDLQKWLKGGLEFCREGTTLSVRQAWHVAVLPVMCSVPLLCIGVGAGIFGATLMDFREPLTAIFIFPPLCFTLLTGAVFAWTVCPRTVPFCMDWLRGELRRGRRRLCALSSVTGVCVVCVQGRGTQSYLELLLDSKPDTIRLFNAGIEEDAHLAAEELARCLNVPCLPNRKGLF